MLAASGAVFAKVTAAFASKEQDQYASAGAVAEEVLSSIRTVFAFGGEKKEATRLEILDNYFKTSRYHISYVDMMQNWSRPVVLEQRKASRWVWPLVSSIFS